MAINGLISMSGASSGRGERGMGTTEGIGSVLLSTSGLAVSRSVWAKVPAGAKLD